MEQLFFFIHILIIFKSPSFIKYSPWNYNLIKLLFDQKYNHLSYSHFLKLKLRNNSELLLNKKKSSQVSSCSSRCSEAGLLESWIYLKRYLSLFLAGDAERAEVERAEMRRKALRWRRRGGGEQEPREAGGGGTWGFTGAERQSAQGLTVRSARVFRFLFFR